MGTDFGKNRTSGRSCGTWQLRYNGITFSAVTSYRFYVTSDLAAQKNGGVAASFMFKRATEDSSGLECEFYSKETSTNLDLRPEIWVTMKAYT